MRLFLNDRPLELLPNFAQNSVLLPAIESAMETWAFSSPTLLLQGEVRTANSARDGVNVISFADTAANRDVT